MRVTFAAWALLGVVAIGGFAAEPKFPLKVNGNRGHLVDQRGVPFLYHAEFAKIPARPFFLGESTYEGEHGDWGSAVQARKQAYWCLLGGGFGHAYGSPDWDFPANWRAVLDQPGAVSLKRLRTLFLIDSLFGIRFRGEALTSPP